MTLRNSMNLKKPTILIDKKKVLANIKRMQQKADKNRVDLRPHFKTHQSRSIGEWFRKQGTQKIAVSSISMARYFKNSGWKDIMIAIPVNILEIDEINDLNQNITIHLVVDSIFAIKYLSSNLKNKTYIWIEIDTGYNRTGIYPSDLPLITEITHICNQSNNLHLQGIMSHTGQAYSSKSIDEISQIYQETLNNMIGVKNELEKICVNEIQISLGDTPTFSIIESFDSYLNEIRPGNYIFFDLMQKQINSCKEDDIAIAIVCPVISILPQLNQLVIYGGGIHLSKEYLEVKNNRKIYGKLAKLNSDYTWNELSPAIYIDGLSQEHGIINAPDYFIQGIKIGDLICIIPVHSCMTANLHSSLYTTDLEKLDKFQFTS